MPGAGNNGEGVAELPEKSAMGSDAALTRVFATILGHLPLGRDQPMAAFTLALEV